MGKTDHSKALRRKYVSHVGNKQIRHFGIEGGTPIIRNNTPVPPFTEKSFHVQQFQSL